MVVTHHGPYPGVESKELGMRYLKSMEIALNDHQDVLLDRSWLSEPIYAKVHRDLESRIDNIMKAMLERAALTANAVVVLCQPPLETCIKNFGARRDAELLTNEVKLARVYAQYGQLTTALPLIKWDYTKDSLFDLDVKIELARGPRNMGPGAGSWRPGVVVLVGERANVSARRIKETVVLPFVSFENKGCSGWLTKQLIDAGLSENQLYWVNAIDTDGNPCDASFIAHLKPKAVIAMGAVAKGWCMLNRVKCVSVPHPMHTKRFAIKESFDVISAQIREALSAA